MQRSWEIWVKVGCPEMGPDPPDPPWVFLVLLEALVTIVATCLGHVQTGHLQSCWQAKAVRARSADDPCASPGCCRCVHLPKSFPGCHHVWCLCEYGTHMNTHEYTWIHMFTRAHTFQFPNLSQLVTDEFMYACRTCIYKVLKNMCILYACNFWIPNPKSHFDFTCLDKLMYICHHQFSSLLTWSYWPPQKQCPVFFAAPTYCKSGLPNASIVQTAPKWGQTQY